MPWLSRGQEGPAGGEDSVHCLCSEIRGHVPTVTASQPTHYKFTPSLSACSLFCALDELKKNSSRLPYYSAQCWINGPELVHKSAAPKIFSSFIACSSIYLELLLLHSSIWSILNYPPRLIYLDSTVHFLHIYSWSSYNCWLEIHHIQI